MQRYDSDKKEKTFPGFIFYFRKNENGAFIYLKNIKTQIFIRVV